MHNDGVFEEMEIKQVVANPRLAALLLASASFDVQNAAACVLCNLSFKAVFAVAIAASGAVPHLLALLAASPRLVDRERGRCANAGPPVLS